MKRMHSGFPELRTIQRKHVERRFDGWTSLGRFAQQSTLHCALFTQPNVHSSSTSLAIFQPDKIGTHHQYQLIQQISAIIIMPRFHISSLEVILAAYGRPTFRDSLSLSRYVRGAFFDFSHESRAQFERSYPSRGFLVAARIFSPMPSLCWHSIPRIWFSLNSFPFIFCFI